MKRKKKNMNRMSSITQKYSRGFYLILMMNVIVFFLSFFNSEYIARQYEQSIRELLELNELFVDIEEANSALYDYTLFHEEDSRENYLDASARITKSIIKLRTHMNTVYSRNIIDLCYMTENFQQKSNELIDNIYNAKHVLREDNLSSLLSIQFEESQEIISYVNGNFKNIYTEKLVSIQKIEKNLKNTRKKLNVASIFILLSSFFICVKYHHRIKEGISSSINKLTKFALHITKTKAYTSEPIILNTNDEISLFADAFNDMLLTIKEQIQQIEENANIKEQLHRVEMENLKISSKLQSSKLNLLQSRINPHFLFNTLNMISRTAYIEEAEETAQLIEATADYLRYNLGNLTKSVTLAQELENVKDYTYIQQCRFQNRIEFIFSINGCESYKIPCMILQPLVENAILHGVGTMINGGKIITRVYSNDERIYLEVEDNGLGITEEKRIMLKEVLQNPNYQIDEHIGINNVYQRLKLFFNNDVEFLISSDQNKTLMQISIPPVEDNKSLVIESV